MKISFDSSTARQSKHGSITGAVYFDFGSDHQFPVAGWNDFVVVLAGWWLAANDDIEHGRAEATLRFMDGPYWIAVISDGTELLKLKCVEDRRSSAPAFEAIVSRADLKAEILRFAHSVVRACSSRQMESADLIDLLRRLSA